MPEITSPPAARCRGLVKRYGELVAVDGLDLEVRAGECFGLLGPNGAGKTTTVEILEGLNPASDGTVEIFGQPWSGRASDSGDDALRQRIGAQLQDTNLPEKLTVEEVIALFRSFYTQGRSVEEAIGLVQLAEKRQVRVEKLSGGQKQRLSLACALVGAPELIFLDEPTTGLDPQARRAIWEVIETFRDAGGTVFLTTHYMEEAARLCDRIAIIDRGKVIALDTPRDLIASLGADQIVEVDLADELPADAFVHLPGVRAAALRGETHVLTVADIAVALPALLAAAVANDAAILRLATHEATLEDVFVHLTGRALRDE